MEIDDLKNFGMTTVEAKIYLEILKIGETQIGNIIKRVGMHRGTVYNSLNSLIEKGFVCFVDKSGVKHYKVCNSKQFDNFIETKQRDLLDSKKRIDVLFEDFNKISSSSDNQGVVVFHGAEAFKTAFLQIYDYCKENKCEYLFQGRGGEMLDATGEAFYKYTQDLKNKMKIRCRVILAKETVDLPYHKYTKGDLRHLSVKLASPVSFWIYGDNVLIVLFKESPMTTIRIASKSLADGFRNYFEYLWKIAVK